jgi:hypothetical protein
MKSEDITVYTFVILAIAGIFGNMAYEQLSMMTRVHNCNEVIIAALKTQQIPKEELNKMIGVCNGRHR